MYFVRIVKHLVYLQFDTLNRRRGTRSFYLDVAMLVTLHLTVSTLVTLLA